MRVVRLLPFETADGAHNMAADEALVHTAADQGVASLRFYAWSPPTLSLGYFQEAAERCTDSRLADLAWVRRPSGGKALVHDHEITYALALPASWVEKAAAWIARAHRVMQAALEQVGIEGSRLVEALDVRLLGDVLCFQQQTAGDLVLAGHKIAGSAQRKHRQCLLQHGSLLLERSEHAPRLPGALDLAKVRPTLEEVLPALAKAWQAQQAWTLEPDCWSDQERDRTKALCTNKYRTSSWNDKR